MPDFSPLDAACVRLADCLPGGGFEAALWGSREALWHTQRNWTQNALVPVWSATKGPAAATTLLLLEQAGLDLATTVSDVWPEFQHAVNFAQLLSHQAGLAAPEGNLSIFDHPAAARSLAAQAPNWPPGSAHGYHPRTYGFLLNEISLRLTDRRLGENWDRLLREPHDLDFFIGLPESEFPRMMKVISGRPSVRPDERAFSQAYMQSQSLTRRAFDSYRGLNATWEFNHPDAWRLASPALGGVGSARGLAKFYSLLNSPAFSDKVRGWMQTEQVSGPDLILHTPTTFTAGFQKDPLHADGSKIRSHYGPSTAAFGHPGAGGSIGLNDPTSGRAFGLVLNVIGPGVFPREEILQLVNAAMTAG